MTVETQPITETETQADDLCKDFDEDCFDVHDHYVCWMGGWFYDRVNHEPFYLAMACGRCPFVFTSKEGSNG